MDDLAQAFDFRARLSEKAKNEAMELRCVCILREGRPIISMLEAPDPVMRTLTPARPHEHGAAKCKQRDVAIRVERPPSPTPVCVRSDSLIGRRVLYQRGTCSGTNEAQRPVPYRRRTDSVGASPTATPCKLSAQIKEERSVSLFDGWIAFSWLSAMVPSAGRWCRVRAGAISSMECQEVVASHFFEATFIEETTNARNGSDVHQNQFRLIRGGVAGECSSARSPGQMWNWCMHGAGIHLLLEAFPLEERIGAHFLFATRSRSAHA